MKDFIPTNVEVVIDGESIWSGKIEDCPYLEHDDKPGDVSPNEIVEYERFKLQWMLDHGYTLDDLIREMQDVMNDRDATDRKSLSSIFDEFERDYGFGASIWPCFDEWIDSGKC